MSAAFLLNLRRSAGLTQAQMAKRMGFTRRGYQDLEEERSSFAPRHLAVLERVSIRLAIEKMDPSLALESVAVDALRLAALKGGPAAVRGAS